MKQRILILTKNYPPQIWGLEKYSYDLYNKLISDKIIVKIIKASPRNEYLLGKKNLSFFYHFFYLFSELYRLSIFAFKALFFWFWYVPKSDLIWSMDGSISWLGLFLGKIFMVKTRVTVHGTDIVWDNIFYQKIIIPLIWKNDEIFAGSENARQECLKRNFLYKKITVDGYSHANFKFLEPSSFDSNIFLESLWISNPAHKIILFSIGRWIERKWFHFFLENVVPFLNPEKFHYILAGFGPYEVIYQSIIQSKKLNNVTLLWKIDDPLQKAKIYKSSDIFIMPNLEIQGSIEGFPVVLLEARFYWLKKFIGYVQGADTDECTNFLWNDWNFWISSINNFSRWKR